MAFLRRRAARFRPLDEPSHSEITALLNLAPGGDHDAPLDQVKVGDPLRVVPCDRVPVDGVAVEGYPPGDEDQIIIYFWNALG